MNSVTNKDRQLMEDQASRQKRKIRSYVFFIILFTVIIGSIITVSMALIQEKESELLSASTPDRAIRAICNLTPKPTSCFDSIWCLRMNFSTDLGEIKTTPSRIFTLSLRAAINQLEDLISANEKAISEVKDSRTLTALKDCNVLFKDSLRLVNASVTAMGVKSDDKIFKVAKSVDDMNEWMSNSAATIDKCFLLPLSHSANKASNNEPPLSAADLHRQDSAASSFSNNSVKRERELGSSEEVEIETVSSRVSDEDDDGSNGRKKLCLTKAQSALLEESFKQHSTLNPITSLSLSFSLCG
ncbi:pectinesterase 1-like [Coffea eugenioides]|uniref:pectinesterase 1-like n=1 Tax=Coffea eugenioides TaxID=49369 RepID=UPI000F60DB20|nr:pectinesterase 1-like [Coffea eugenioides]